MQYNASSPTSISSTSTFGAMSIPSSSPSALPLQELLQFSSGRRGVSSSSSSRQRSAQSQRESICLILRRAGCDGVRIRERPLVDVLDDALSIIDSDPLYASPSVTKKESWSQNGRQ
jgi:hypothetical protein